MDRLIAELQRLYFLPDQRWHGQPGEEAGAGVLAGSLGGGAAGAFDPVGGDGRVRALVADFGRAAGWEPVARLHQAVQADLDLPAPAVSVSPGGGYGLWFSLAEPVPLAQARTFLGGLRARYLADLPPAGVGFHPDVAGEPPAASDRVPLVPALDPATGKWSAYIDPAMGSMFAEEPGLEMAPNLEKQADLLAGFGSIRADDFRRALERLGAQAEPAGRPEPILSVGSHYSDPVSFLLAVMNDPSASPGHRIEAAKALLPYVGKPFPQ